jgi:hypothetical protein
LIALDVFRLIDEMLTKRDTIECDGRTLSHVSGRSGRER